MAVAEALLGRSACRWAGASGDGSAGEGSACCGGVGRWGLGGRGMGVDYSRRRLGLPRVSGIRPDPLRVLSSLSVSHRL